MGGGGENEWFNCLAKPFVNIFRLIWSPNPLDLEDKESVRYQELNASILFCDRVPSPPPSSPRTPER